ncbi:MAG: prolyl oligopeptidase family serine peptidase [Bacteroidetes bacterium]|nr:prolyl oligopeptidase family serine peptidase [Bacteroidota bacterium]
MKKIIYCLLLTGIVIMFSCMKKQKIDYPLTKADTITNTYFGVTVPDPYRWLENDTTKETAQWVEEENKVTFAYLDKIPFRDKLRERITSLWNYPKYGVPFRKGSHYFFSKNDGLQNQSIYYIQDSLGGEPSILLDPNKFSQDGTIALAGLAISKDGKYLAYATAEAGSDWNKIYVMDIDTKEKLADELLWVKFSGMAWKDDGFYYSRYTEPKGESELSSKNENQKVYYHKLGTPQSTDVLIYENKENPMRMYGAATTEDERFLLLYESESTQGNALYYKDLGKKDGEFIQLAPGFEFEYGVVDNMGDELIIRTNDSAPRYKLMLVDLKNPAINDWKAIIPEKTEVLDGVTLAGGKVIAQYMKDAQSKAYIYDTKGTQEGELTLPGLGTLAGFSGRIEDDIAFYLYTSFTFPATVYKYNVPQNRSEIYYKSDIDFNPDDYVTKQIFYQSKDGTNVPMFIVHKKDLKLDGKNPVFLYGYGGFNISMTPYFSISRLIFLENGGVYAMPNIRGGGEYGEEWHKAGTKLQKQNVFDDFIAAAEYLIKEKYSNPSKIAISGGSNGGLLVGACMIQRPDLFKVALPAVGVMDMLRYHKFTIGWAWASDYGTSEDDTAMFNYLYGYSPLHTIKEGVNYPATLITTADHDDRVVPAHSFKFAAALQAKNKGDNPVLIRIETRAGHGAGTPTAKLIDEVTDTWAFTLYNLGVVPK